MVYQLLLCWIPGVYEIPNLQGPGRAGRDLCWWPWSSLCCSFCSSLVLHWTPDTKVISWLCNSCRSSSSLAGSLGWCFSQGLPRSPKAAVLSLLSLGRIHHQSLAGSMHSWTTALFIPGLDLSKPCYFSTVGSSSSFILESVGFLKYFLKLGVPLMVLYCQK